MGGIHHVTSHVTSHCWIVTYSTFNMYYQSTTFNNNHRGQLTTPKNALTTPTSAMKETVMYSPL